MQEEKQKKPSKAQLRKQADKQAIEVVHKYVSRYFELDENNEAELTKNEDEFITAILNIYDPHEKEPQQN